MRIVLYFVLASSIAVIAYTRVQASVRSQLKKVQDGAVNGIGVIEGAHKHLAAEYRDKDGRLVADPPADPSRFLNPDTLVVAYIVDADAQEVDWAEFQKHLTEITGKKVVLQPYRNDPSDIADAKAGKIQIVAIHAADTPYLVNNAGYEPVAVLANEGGDATGHHFDLAVRASSDIRSLADVKGHTLTCTTPMSVAGYRAAVALLLQSAGLRPNVDYLINFSQGQKRSIAGLAKGEYEVTALSDDKVQAQLNQGEIKETDFRIIFRSPVIPRTTIGYFYNLHPDLAAKVKQAILDFQNVGGALDNTTDKPPRFFPVDYKKDFEFVRQIDDSFDPRLGGKPLKAKAATGPAAE